MILEKFVWDCHSYILYTYILFLNSAQECIYHKRWEVGGRSKDLGYYGLVDYLIDCWKFPANKQSSILSTTIWFKPCSYTTYLYIHITIKFLLLLQIQFHHSFDYHFNTIAILWDYFTIYFLPLLVILDSLLIACVLGSMTGCDYDYYAFERPWTCPYSWRNERVGKFICLWNFCYDVVIFVISHQFVLAM
jgi:hypothetical protein